MSKRKAKRELKKASKTGSRRERKTYTKRLKSFNVEAGAAKIAQFFGQDDARDRAVLNVAARRIEQKKKQGLERRAVASLALPLELRRNIFSFLKTGTPQIPPIPKRKK